MDLTLVSDGLKKVPYRALRPRNINFSRISDPSKASDLSKNLKDSSDLKIIPYGEAIANLIQKSTKLRVDLPEDYGQTYYLPYLMASKGYSVRVALPTEQAVKLNYTVQKSYSPFRVGFIIGEELHYSEDDQIVYGRSEDYLARLLKLTQSSTQSSSNQVSGLLGELLFIEIGTDLSYPNFLIKLIELLEVKPKLVIFSHGFEYNFKHDLKHNFPTGQGREIGEIPVYSIPIQKYPVERLFQAGFQTGGQTSLGSFPGNFLEAFLVSVLKIISEELTNYHQGQENVIGIVFCPGLSEVYSRTQILKEAFVGDQRVEVLPIYNLLDLLSGSNDAGKTGKIKIVVTTDFTDLLFESRKDLQKNLLKDLTFIIDDLLEKTYVPTSNGGIKLILRLTPKIKSQRRQGLLGRNLPGRYYPLISQDEYIKLPLNYGNDFNPKLILSLWASKLGSALLNSDIFKSFEASEVSEVSSLIKPQMVPILNKLVGFPELPLKFPNAYLVYLGYELYGRSVEVSSPIHLRTVLALASMIEVYEPELFQFPTQGETEPLESYLLRREDHLKKYYQRFLGETDLHTFVNIFWSLIIDIDTARRYDTFGKYPFVNYLKEWAERNKLSYPKLKEFVNLLRRVESILLAKTEEDLKIREAIPISGLVEILPRGLFGEDGFSKAFKLPGVGFETLGNSAVSLFLEAYQSNYFILDSSGYPNYVNPKTGDKVQLKSITTADFLTGLRPTDKIPLALVAARLEEFGKADQKILRAEIWAPSDFNQILEITEF